MTTTERPISVPIPIELLEVSALNERKTCDDAGIRELAASIRERGLLQPLIARPMKGLSSTGHRGACEVIAGQRRLLAARLAGLKEVPTTVVDVDDDEARLISVTENAARQDVPILEEADAVAALLAACDGNAAEASRRLGKTPAWVARRAQIAKLSSNARAAHLAGQMTDWRQRTLEKFATLPLEHQDRLVAAGKFVLQGMDWRIDNEVAASTMRLDQAPWDPADAQLIPAAGACSACLKRASAAPLLFDADQQVSSAAMPARATLREAKDACLAVECWRAKLRAHSAQIARQLMAAERPVRMALPLHGKAAPDWLPVGVPVIDAGRVSLLGAKPAKPTSKLGAGETFVVDPSGALLRWRPPAAGGKAKAAPTKVALSPAGQLSLLAARRQRLAATLVASDVAKVFAAPPPHLTLIRLAAAFGTLRPTEHQRLLWDDAGGRSIELLWEALRRTMTDRWKRMRYATAAQGAGAWEEIMQAAKLCAGGAVAAAQKRLEAATRQIATPKALKALEAKAPGGSKAAGVSKRRARGGVR